MDRKDRKRTRERAARLSQRLAVVRAVNMARLYPGRGDPWTDDAERDLVDLDRSRVGNRTCP